MPKPELLANKPESPITSRGGWDVLDANHDSSEIDPSVLVRDETMLRDELLRSGVWKIDPKTNKPGFAPEIENDFYVEFVEQLEDSQSSIHGDPRVVEAVEIARREADKDGVSDAGEIPYIAADHIFNDGLHKMEQRVDDATRVRIAANELPWTMPYSELNKDTNDALRRYFDAILYQDIPPMPDDILHINAFRTDDDERLLGGLVERHTQSGDTGYTREELQAAGVFFINKIGEGEQPIFGVPIPDAKSEGGLFDPSRRAVLTKEEFEKIYRYQQENEYGAGLDVDFADVQKDMLMFATMATTRGKGWKPYGGNNRENKYHQTWSPFIDSGFRVTLSMGSEFMDGDGVSWRINTIPIHLANAHPEYPGVSEMFSEHVAHDQRYIGVGEFVKNYYIAPPTEQEAKDAVIWGGPTRREQVWTKPSTWSRHKLAG